MARPPKKSPSTHTKTLARRYAAASGLTYQQALQRVRAAADAGRLPARLDAVGIADALTILNAPAQHEDRDASTPSTASNPAISQAINQVPTHVADRPDPYYLIPSFLRVLRKIWQGRVTVAPVHRPRPGHSDHTFYTDTRPVTVETSIILTLLHRDGYATWPPLTDLTPNETAAVQVTDLGLETLDHCTAMADKFTDGLPDNAYSRLGAGVRPQRRPYVGHGADGCRRSADIDLSEAESLPTGPHQPGWSEQTEARRQHLHDSAPAWLRQAQGHDYDDQVTALRRNREAAEVFATLATPATTTPTPGTEAAGAEQPFPDPTLAGVFDAYLDTCPPADTTTMQIVANNLAQADQVATWWHPTGGQITEEGIPTADGGRFLLRATRTTLTDDGEVVFVFDTGQTSELSFDWTGEPDKAARHRIHPDAMGITIFSPHGVKSATYRALHRQD